MLKIKFKKLFALFLALVLVTMQVFVAFAHEADAESTNQNVNPQANEEVLDDAHNHEHDEIFNNEEINEETNSETEIETEFVGEEIDEEVNEETEEIEEPENPEDLVNDETEIINETETDASDNEVKDENEVIKESNNEEIEEETETNDEIETETTEVETETETTESNIETEDDEIEVEIVDGEIVELNKNETTTETTSETEEQLQEEIAETVPVKNANAGDDPEITWVDKPKICEETYTISIITEGNLEITSVTYNGEPQTLPDDPTINFDLAIFPDYNGTIEIIVENELGNTVSAIFPKREQHTIDYVNSMPETDYGLRTISAICTECGANLGTAEFTTTQGVEKEWTDGGVKPFDEPTYSADWEVDPLVLEYTNNTKKGEADDPVIANRPTATLKDSTGTYTFAIAYFTIKRNSKKEPIPSGLVAHNASSATADDGSISGVDIYTMEWQTVLTQPYKPIPSSPWTGLTPGTYYIRFKENDQHVASNAVTITVGFNQPPSPGGGGGGATSVNGALSLQALYAPIGVSIPDVKAQLILDQATNTMRAAVTANGSTTYVTGWALVHDNLQNADNWYYFDPENGLMQTGWLTENGNVYYLYTQEDHLKGRLYSGWHNISGIVYYFSETNYALEHMMSAADAAAKGIVTWEESIAAFQEGRILEATKGIDGLGITDIGYSQNMEAQAQAQLQLQIQNAVSIELMREAFASRQDLIRAVERGAISVEDAYAASSGGKSPLTEYRSNFQSNQEIISQIANLISAYR